VIIGRLDKHAAKTLMRALCMAMSHVLADEFSQVASPNGMTRAKHSSLIDRMKRSMAGRRINPRYSNIRVIGVRVREIC
jgi:hypothetical protein